jgi:4-diphosphocytidyl-2C-methyl-D-erythritol kinase
VLVTPAVAVPTSAVFAAFDAGGPPGPPDPRSTRLTSEHLASELRGGLDGAALVARAGVLASANDLTAAAVSVVDGLTTLRRALTRRLGRPVGLSGSGPTLWVLYPSADAAEAAASEVRAAVDDGSLITPGGGPPSIIATSIAASTNEPEGRT